MKTKNYYDNNAQGFVDSTFLVDMQSLYQPFLNLLPDFGRILDLGCGSDVMHWPLKTWAIKLRQWTIQKS